MRQFTCYLILICIICTLSSELAFGQSGSFVISANRRVNWSRVGVAGGMPRLVDQEFDFAKLKVVNPGLGDDEVFVIV